MKINLDRVKELWAERRINNLKPPEQGRCDTLYEANKQGTEVKLSHPPTTGLCQICKYFEINYMATICINGELNVCGRCYLSLGFAPHPKIDGCEIPTKACEGCKTLSIKDEIKNICSFCEDKLKIKNICSTCGGQLEEQYFFSSILPLAKFCTACSRKLFITTTPIDKPKIKNPCSACGEEREKVDVFTGLFPFVRFCNRCEIRFSALYGFSQILPQPISKAQKELSKCYLCNDVIDGHKTLWDSIDEDVENTKFMFLLKIRPKNMDREICLTCSNRLFALMGKIKRIVENSVW